VLKFDPDRAPVTPKDAATVLVLRDGDEGLELFCVRRNAASAFMGGAVVFVGGKLDAADRSSSWIEQSSGCHPRATTFADDVDHARALAICACREALEEGTLLPCSPAVDHARLETARAALEAGTAFDHLVAELGCTLTTDAMVPFARWITPVAEQRRYDARFFLARLPAGQRGQHDDHEVVSSVWSTPARMLAAFEAGDVWLAPPTTRCLELLSPAADVEAALSLAAEQSLLPICPQLVPGDELVLALPGDPGHDVAERRVAGATRFVLDGNRLVSATQS
jgi:8-oxo-dGTP pyrophosphatase MutT (NUDIX family)